MVIPMHNAQCWEKISSGQRNDEDLDLSVRYWRAGIRLWDAFVRPQFEGTNSKGALYDYQRH